MTATEGTSEVMREDRIMELSTRGRRESDGEGVRTREENWEGGWVMGLKGAKGAERMKVKKERQQAKSAPMNRAACRFMGCSGHHYTSTRVDGETQLKWHLWGCVCLSAHVLRHTFILPPLAARVLQNKLTSKLNRNESPAVRRRLPVLCFSTIFLPSAAG